VWFGLLCGCDNGAIRNTDLELNDPQERVETDLSADALDVALPTEGFTAGQPLDLQIDSQRKVVLLAFGLESDGVIGLRLPSGVLVTQQPSGQSSTIGAPQADIDASIGNRCNAVITTLGSGQTMKSLARVICIRVDDPAIDPHSTFNPLRPMSDVRIELSPDSKTTQIRVSVFQNGTPDAPVVYENTLMSRSSS